MTPALPPKPCPCVILISGVTSQYTKKIPVTVVGETTAPVPQPAPATVEPKFQVVNLHVAGGVTLASAFGGAAPRTVEFQVSNVGTLTETPVLVGRWGTGNKINNVIKMPTLQEVAAGKSVAVRAHFSLPALSMGSYTVKVFVQVVGFHNVASDSATTSTWPFALFIALLVLLELLLLAITKIVRTRRRRAAGPGGVDSAQTPNGGGPGSGPQNANGLVARSGRRSGRRLGWPASSPARCTTPATRPRIWNRRSWPDGQTGSLEGRRRGRALRPVGVDAGAVRPAHRRCSRWPRWSEPCRWNGRRRSCQDADEEPAEARTERYGCPNVGERATEDRCPVYFLFVALTVHLQVVVAASEYCPAA